MTVTLRNTTKGDLGVGFGIMVPAGGSAICSMDQWKAALKSSAVQGWLNAGKIIPEMNTPLSEVREFRDPAPEEGPSEPRSAPEAGVPSGVASDTRESLFARARALGLNPSPRWKDDTLRRKVAEAEE